MRSTVYCCVCGEGKPEIYSVDLDYNGYDTVCAECYAEFVKCGKCKKKFRDGDVEYDEVTEKDYCESCMDILIEDRNSQ